MNYILQGGLPLLGGLARSHLVQHVPLAKEMHFHRAPLLHRNLLAMLSFLVPVENGPLVEAPPTGSAVVGLLPSVDPLVSD